MAKHEQQAYERLGAKVLTLPDAMARDRRIPGVLATVSRRHDSPLGATVFLIGASLVTLAVDQWSTGLFTLVVVYLLMAVGSLRSFASSPGRIRLVVSAVIAIAITAGAIYGSFYKVTSPAIYAPWIALAVLVIGFASTFVTRARRSASSELSDLTKSIA
jgi:amino acid transporter